MAVPGLSPGLSPLTIFATYVLSEDELRDDKPLDILTGFGVLDGGNRVFVVEGLRDGGLLEVLKAIPRDSRVNDGDFKMLHHPGIGYSKRLYGMYGLRLKQIKIRMPLEKLVKDRSCIRSWARRARTRWTG